jgi:hypothetical protein
MTLLTFGHTKSHSVSRMPITGALYIVYIYMDFVERH